MKTTRGERGQTAAELALVMPVLLLVLFAIIQFGVAFKDYLSLTDAVRAGARKAAVSRNEPNPVSTTESAVRAAAVDLSASKLQVTVTSTWEPGSDVSVGATYPYSINLLGKVVYSGSLTSRTTERVE